MDARKQDALRVKLHEAQAHRGSGRDSSFVRSAMEAHNEYPDRPEPLYELANYYRERGMNHLGTLFAKAGLPPDLAVLRTQRLGDVAPKFGLLEEYSICANYALDPATKSQGHFACNWLALSRDVPDVTRKQAQRNLLFYVEPVAEVLPSVVAQEIVFAPPGGYVASNPSVTRWGDKLFVAQRTVNFTLGDGNQHITHDGGPLRSRNFLLELDGSLAVNKAAEILPPPDFPAAVYPHVLGFEDPRLFVWQQALWCSSCVRQLDPSGKAQQVISRIELASNGEYQLTNWRVMEFGGLPRDEKNWMPRVHGDSVEFLYSVDPSRLVDTYGRLISENQCPIDAEQWRGGSQLIAFREGWLALVHETRWNGHTRHYPHRLVWFDNELSVRGASRLFYFHRVSGRTYPQAIEFAAGIAWHPDGKRLVFSYGVDEREAWLSCASADDVANALEGTETFCKTAQADPKSVPSPLTAHNHKSVGAGGVSANAARRGADVYATQDGEAARDATGRALVKKWVGRRRCRTTISISCVETRREKIEQAVLAVERTAECVQVDCLYWFSREPFGGNLPGVPVVNIIIASQFDDFFADTSDVYLRLIPGVVTTDFNLIVQHDGFAVNKAAWDQEFLTYDYLGACWPWMWNGGPYWEGPIVGNGGFSLRSQRLYQALRQFDARVSLTEIEDDRAARPEYHALSKSGIKQVPEDLAICQWHRQMLTNEFGITFSPPEIANKFSVETVCDFTRFYLGRSFGFHGIAAAPYYGVRL